MNDGDRKPVGLGVILAVAAVVTIAFGALR